MIVLIDKQRTAVLHQGVNFEIPVIHRFAKQKVTAAAAAPAPLFHHVNIAIAIGIEIVGGIT